MKADDIIRSVVRGARLSAVLVDQSVGVLSEQERLRSHPEVGVHDLRVAMRRLRSTLTVFSDYVPEECGDLVDQLRSVAAGLGTARDREVLAERASSRGESLGDAAPHLADHDPRAAVLDELGTVGFLDMVAAVRSLAQMDVRQPSQESIEVLLRRQLQRVTRRLDRAVMTDQADRDVRLHDLRKAVKRSRYVLEEFGCLPPDPDACTALEEAQEYLGRWQDAVVEARVTGLPQETHSPAEWAALRSRLADLRDRIEPSISLRSGHDAAGA